MPTIGLKRYYREAQVAADQIWSTSPPFGTGNTRVMSSILQGVLTWLWVNFQIQLDRKKNQLFLRTYSTAPPFNKANLFITGENKKNCQSGAIIYPLAQDHHPAAHFG